MCRLQNNPFFEERLFEVFERDPQWDDPRSEFGEGTDVIQYEEGTIVLHFVDAETDETLWIGWAQGDIGRALKDPVKMREWVEDAGARMFKDFPVLTVPRGTRG